MRIIFKQPYQSMRSNNVFLRYLLVIGLLMGASNLSVAQLPEMKLKRLSKELDSLARVIPGLKHKSDLALSDIPLHDYLRSLGRVHEINLYVDEYPKAIVTNDFKNESVKSIFLFICKKFELDIEPVGTILNFVPYEKPKAKPIVAPPKELKIEFKKDKLAFDLEGDSLVDVLRKVSRLTGETIITMPNTAGTLSGYIPPNEFETSLENLLFSNGFSLQKHRKGFYMVQAIANNTAAGRAGNRTRNANQGAMPQGPNAYSLEIATDTTGKEIVFLTADDKEIIEIIRDLYSELNLDYFMLDPIEGNTTLHVDGVSLENVLKYILKGTEYTFRNDEGVYLFGKRDMEGLRSTKIVNLKYRPTEKVIELLPSELKKGVELKEFVELNRIILSGSSQNIREIEAFIKEIDRPVPMVKIEMMVVDVDFNRLLEAGVKAGLRQPGDSVGAAQAIFPGLDYNLTGAAINTIVANSGIPGLANLGALKSNFYLSIQAQESRGLLKVVTRPVISTLNGNEASLKIGQTQYYRLQTDINSNGAVNAYTQVAQRFETIEINTTINVKPYVSQDGMVTLDLKPTFTSPGVQADPNIPPTILTRSFQSTIRVKDGETVVLGGLSREASSNSSEGLPFLSRVPIIKWFFGTNSKNKSRSSLIIYITPTIEYN